MQKNSKAMDFTIKKNLALGIAFVCIFLAIGGCGNHSDGTDPGNFDDGRENAGSSDLNGDGYPELVVGSVGGYGGSQDYIYVFNGNPDGIAAVAAYKIRYDNLNALAIDDVNNDGYADLVVGISNYNGIGRVCLRLGAPEGLEDADHQYLDGEPDYVYFGDAVALNDLNGDGYLDLVVGASNRDHGHGRVYIYLGSEAGLNDAPYSIVEYAEGGIRFGEALASGDINGDGQNDLVVGAPGSKKIFIFNGPADILGNSPSKILNVTNLPDSYFLEMKILVDDVQRDGYADLVLCKREKQIFPCPPDAPVFDCGDIVDDRVEVYHGTSAGLEESPVTRILSGYLSGAIAIGDTNADGYLDVAVGGLSGVVVYEGSASGINNDASQSLAGDNRFGGAVCLNDLNGDGYSDLAVGAVGTDTGEFIGDKGKVFVYMGGMSGIEIEPSQVIEGENTGDRFGYLFPF